jgi:hypothetical protein
VVKKILHSGSHIDENIVTFDLEMKFNQFSYNSRGASLSVFNWSDFKQKWRMMPRLITWRNSITAWNGIGKSTRLSFRLVLNYCLHKHIENDKTTAPWNTDRHRSRYFLCSGYGLQISRFTAERPSWVKALFPSANVSKKLTKRHYCSVGKMCPFDLIYLRPDITGS